MKYGYVRVSTDGQSIAAQVAGVMTGEGSARAVAAGVKMGRKPKLTPHQQKEALGRVDAGERLRDIARSYNVSHSTISRLSG